MQRRQFLVASAAATATAPTWQRSLLAAAVNQRFADAIQILRSATRDRQVSAAVLHVSRPGDVVNKAFGQANNVDAMFLLGSISKPINIAAVMTLYDQKLLRLDDRVQRFLPDFRGGGHERVTIHQLLTHVSGLPDQLQYNASLRRQNAPLSEFIRLAAQTPLSFAPGSKYQYSSMGILLAAHIAERISGMKIADLVQRRVFDRLQMFRSVQGMGRFPLSEFVTVQMEGAAPESGGGNPASTAWNWNSEYWRQLGAPWGGTHASAPDLGRFLQEFMNRRGEVVLPATAALMTRNHNPPGFESRGLGFVVGPEKLSPACSPSVFGHTGSTGTICWADPETKTVCVILTSLPSRATQPHPRQVAADSVADTVRRS